MRDVSHFILQIPTLGAEEGTIKKNDNSDPPCSLCIPSQVCIPQSSIFLLSLQVDSRFRRQVADGPHSCGVAARSVSHSATVLASIAAAFIGIVAAMY